MSFSCDSHPPIIDARTSSGALRREPPGTLDQPLPGPGSDWRTWPIRLLIITATVSTLIATLHLLLPALSHSIADNLPANWVRSASEQMLGSLDHTVLVQSRQASAQFERLRARFSNLNAPPEGAPPYRLVSGKSMAPEIQMLSLPSGDIIISENFLTKAIPLETLIALLCVELGHIQLRHALHTAVEDKLLWLGSAALVGSEQSSIDALGAGLAHADYSLEQLIAADRYAQSMLRANGFPDDLLALALEKAPDNTSPAQFQPSAQRHRQYLSQRIKALLLQR